MAINDLQFNSDYSNDLIVGLWENSFNVPSGSGFTITTINHSLGFIPLANGNYSTSTDFQTSNEIKSSYIGGGISVQLRMFMENSTITLIGYNTTGSTVTIYYKIYAYAPDDLDPDIAQLTSTRSDLVFNTDNTYLKILSSSHITISNTPVIVPHNLGYVPYIEAWTQQSASKAPTPFINTPITTYNYAAVTANTTNVTFWPDTFNGVNRYDYRIYLDD